MKNKGLVSSLAAIIAVQLFAVMCAASWFSHNSSVKTTNVDIIYQAKLANGKTLKMGSYKLEIPLNSKSPDLKFYQHGKLVASVPAQVKSEAHARRKQLFPLMETVARFMRHSHAARRLLVGYQSRCNPGVYADLFEKYRPDLVIASSPCCPMPPFLLRKPASRGVPSAAAIISWDSSSSYGLPGAKVDWITCWSEIQKQELIGGADWLAERVNVSGMPPYDGYVRKTWLLPRQEYFRLHGLDPQRKLLAYASSFVSWSPNIQNVEALADLVIDERLSQPAQLLVRLHPIHMSGHYVEEADRIRTLARQHAHIRVVEPVPLGQLGHYSGEDTAEKTSMRANSDVFLTVASPMRVEASFQRKTTARSVLDA